MTAATDGGASFRLADVAAATGGKLYSGRPDQIVSGVATDSRQVTPGQLFVALKGSTGANGHDFVGDALRRGAAACLVEQVSFAPPTAAVVVVENCLHALARLASWHLDRLRAAVGLRVVAVTGSVGKTSTRRLCAAVLAQDYAVLEAEGNLNTEVGVPLTCLRATAANQVVVLEFAMRGLGQIRYLAEVARPDVGVITRIGPSHLETLGSMERIVEAKAELVSALPPDGVAILNADDPWQRTLPDHSRARVVWYGRAASAAVRAEGEQDLGLGGVAFQLRIDPLRRELHLADPRSHPTPDDTTQLPADSLLTGQMTARPAAARRVSHQSTRRQVVRLRLVGSHHVENALAAAACGSVFGCAARDIARALAQVGPVHGRLQARDLGRILLVDDTYNANPPSMKAALQTLVQLAPPERRVAVLADMLELGTAEESAHREVGALAAGANLRLLVTVGSRARWIHEESLASGLPVTAAVHCPRSEFALAILAERLEGGDTVLVKGSRGMQMEAVVAWIERWASPESP